MKPIKILLCAALAGALALAANHAQALDSVVPVVKLSISGSLTYSIDTTTNHAGTTKGSPLLKVSLTGQELINLLNASSAFTNALTNEFGSVSSNQIPAGSYFLWDFDAGQLIITNANGFQFVLNDNLSDINFGGLQMGEQTFFGTFSNNNTTHAGSETDQTGVYFTFDDQNGNEIEVYGLCILTWTYTATTTGSQKTTVSVSMGAGGDAAEVNGNDAVPIFTATGSGTAMDAIGNNPYLELLNRRRR